MILFKNNTCKHNWLLIRKKLTNRSRCSRTCMKLKSKHLFLGFSYFAFTKLCTILHSRRPTCCCNVNSIGSDTYSYNWHFCPNKQVLATLLQDYSSLSLKYKISKYFRLTLDTKCGNIPFLTSSPITVLKTVEIFKSRGTVCYVEDFSVWRNYCRILTNWKSKFWKCLNITEWSKYERRSLLVFSGMSNCKSEMSGKCEMTMYWNMS